MKNRFFYLIVRQAYRRYKKWFPSWGLSQRLGLFRGAKSRLLRFLAEEAVPIHGFSMHVDELDTLQIAKRRKYNEFETSLFPRLAAPGTTALDIGANIGYFTLLLARSVGPKGKIYAFEPDPANYRVLESNVRRNGFHNVELSQKAVGETAGSTFLYRNAANLGDHRTYDFAGNQGKIAVEVVCLDAAVGRQDPPVSFVKIDVQGQEPPVLRGMRGLLRRSPEAALYVEFWPYGLSQAGHNPKELLSLLQNEGFEILYVDASKHCLRRLSHETIVDLHPVDSKSRAADLLCLKKISDPILELLASP